MLLSRRARGWACSNAAPKGRFNMSERERLKLRQAVPPSEVGLPWPGQGGVFAGAFDGSEGAYPLVLAETKPSDLMDWMSGRAWVAALTIGRHNDFRMPTRAESAALVERFPGLCLAPEYWLWTDDTAFDPSMGDHHVSAWRRYQGGHESPLGKTLCGTVIAVRRVRQRGTAR